MIDEARSLGACRAVAHRSPTSCPLAGWFGLRARVEPPPSGRGHACAARRDPTSHLLSLTGVTGSVLTPLPCRSPLPRRQLPVRRSNPRHVPFWLPLWLRFYHLRDRLQPAHADYPSDRGMADG
eukprot:7388853-Prymnesium_polylepis.1